MSLAIRGLFAGLLFSVSVIAAAQVSHQVWIDVDNDAATGCAAANAAGAQAGFELLLAAEVSGAPPQVTSLQLSRCEAGVFAAPQVLDGGYPVGLDNGTAGADVVEMAMARELAPDGAGDDWRLVFASESARGADILGPVLAAGIGFMRTAPAPVPQPTIVPTLSSWGLLVLCVAFALGLLWMARRQRGLLSVLLMAGGLMVLGIAWAANYLLDGQVGDWDVAALSGDPAGDTTGVDEAVDLVAGFAARENGNVYFRADVLDSENNAPVVADQVFAVDENSAAGTAVGTVAASDADAADTLAFAITAGNTGSAFAIDAASGAITVASAAAMDFEASAQFILEVTVSDDATVVASTTATITIDINDLNEAPTIADATFDVVEDSPDGTAVGSVVASDPDTSAPNDTLSYTITAGNTGGAFAIDAAGAITVAASAEINDVNSPFNLTVEVSDGPGLAATAAVTVTVIDINHAPSFVAGAPVVVDEDAGAQLLAGWATAISDGDGGTQVLSFTIGNDNPALFAAGPTLDEASGDLAFTPADDANGVANLSIVLGDDGGTALGGVDESAPQQVTITVNAVNDAPVAVADAFATSEDSALVVPAPGVLGNDSDVENDPLTAVLVADVANGTLLLDFDGSFSYTPDANFNGSDGFSYRANDGALDSNIVAVTIDVASVEDLPVAVADAATVSEDDPATTIAVQANDVDADGGANLVASVTQPANGTVVITNAGADLSYQPDPNYCNDGSPTDDFSYTLSPGGSTATVAVTVTCVNDLPQLDLDADDSAGTGGADYATSFSEGGAALAISDADASLSDPDTASLTSLTATLTNLLDAGEETLSADTTGTAISANFDTTTPGLGVLTLTGPDTIANFQAVLRSIAYRNTSNAPDETTRIVQLVANDGLGDGNTAVASITVIASDTAPTAVADAATVAEDAGASAIDVLANDTDPDGGPISIVSVTQPADGTVAITGSGSGLTYAPDANYCNDPPGTTPDTFTYTLTPGGSSTTVSVTVTCVDDAPVAVADAATVAEDSGATAIDVLANDTDVDAGSISIASVTQPANGTVVISGGGTGLSYEPDANYCNDGVPLDTFSYTLSPGGSSTMVSMTVTCVDDAPVAVADAATVTEDSGANAIDVLANDTDVDAGDISITSTTDPAGGTVTITGSGTGLSYQPDPQYCNDPPGTTPDTFSYTLAPGGSSALVSVTVTCVDDPPVAQVDAAIVLEDAGTTAIDVLANDTDVDAGPISVTSVTQPTNGTVAISGGGTGVTYAPDANYCNDGVPLDVFTYTLSPGGSSASVSITVTCVNDAPIVSPPPATFGVLGNVSISVGAASPDGLLSSVSDVDGPTPITVQSASYASAQGGSVSVNQATGAWSYDPPAGYEGADSFQYSVCDAFSLSACSAPATVNLSVSGMVWFVDSEASACTSRASGCGRLSSPYSSLAAFQAENDGAGGGLNPGNGDAVFLFERATAYVGPVALRDGQSLVGQDATATLASIAGLTVPTFSAALPVMNPGAGNATTITSASDAIRITQGASAIVRGLAIGNVTATGTAINMNTGATSFGTLAIGDSVSPDVSIATNGRILNLASGALAATLVQASTSGSSQQGVALSGVTGTLALGTGGAAGTTGPALQVTGAMPNTTWSGNLAKSSADRLVSITGAGGGNLTLSGTLACNTACTGIEVASRNAGTISFSGASKTLNTGASNAVTLSNNTGATIAFSGGGLDIDTSTGTGFSASGGGTVSVAGSGNSINATSGIALNVASTTIGAGGLVFQRIDAANAANGIVLNATGATAGLSVTGTGAVGSGGTIANVVGADLAVAGNGIYLQNTSSVSLAWMTITGSDNSGIYGDDVTNFALANSTVRNSGDNASGIEAGVRFQELLGTASITDSVIDGSIANNIHLTPASGVLSSLSITGTTIGPNNATLGSNGLSIVSSGSAVMNVSVGAGTVFQSNRASGILTTVEGTSLTLSVNGATFRDNNVGIDFGNGTLSDVNLTASGNTLLRHFGSAVNLVSSTLAENSAEYRANLVNLSIGDGSANSGSTNAFGIASDMRGDVDAIQSLGNSTIRNTDIEGIFVQSRLDNDADAQIGRLDFTLLDNLVTTPDDNSAFPFGFVYGTRVESRNTTDLCFDVFSNTSAGVGGAEHFRARQRDTSTFRVERLATGAQNDVAMASHLVSQNDPGATASATVATSFTGVANGTCRNP